LSLIAFQNINGDVVYVFEDDIRERLPKPIEQWTALPNTPRVIHATTRYMSEEPILDSIITMYDLDETLSREAADDRELKAYQQQIVRM
jgi:hypothetical protein